jgi:hypothetical protein
MPILSARQADSKQADDAVLKRMRELDALGTTPPTQKAIGCTRHRLLKLMQEKLIKRAGAAKNVPSGRNAVTYTLTAKGAKRVEKL